MPVAAAAVTADIAGTTPSSLGHHSISAILQNWVFSCQIIVKFDFDFLTFF